MHARTRDVRSKHLNAGANSPRQLHPCYWIRTLLIRIKIGVSHVLGKIIILEQTQYDARLTLYGRKNGIKIGEYKVSQNKNLKNPSIYIFQLNVHF